MKYEEYIADAEKGVAEFNSAMSDLFPNLMHKAIVNKALGEAVFVSFANVASKEDAPHKIIENASGHMTFIMHLMDNFGRPADKEKFSIELITRNYEVRDAGIKFRKINAKSPSEALRKLVKWFEKNAEAIEAL